MAVCEYCNKEMLTHCSCLPYLIINGEKVPRIKYGKEKMWSKHHKPAGICHDCSCKLGEYHHFRCDMEMNPKTNTQLLLDLLDDDITDSIVPSK